MCDEVMRKVSARKIPQAPGKSWFERLLDWLGLLETR